MATARNNSLLAALCVAVSAACVYYGSGLHPIWLLTWLAPIPVLVVAPRLRAATSFVTAFLAFALGGLNMWSYLHGLIRLPTTVCIEAIATPAFFFALFVLFFRAQVLRGATLGAVFTFPALWIVYEYISYLLSPHGTFGSLAYTQMNFLPVLQLASITGVWGISYVLLFFSAAIAILFSNSTARKPVATALAVVLCAVLGFCLLRLYVFPGPPPDTTVGLLASDLPNNLVAEGHDDVLRLMHDYAAEARYLAQQGAQVIVIPEKVAVTPEADISEIDTLLGSVAHDAHVWIVVGLIHPTSNAKWNEARVYAPAGNVVAAYEKHHMLPPYESSFTVGTSRVLLPQSHNTWGVTICKDMDFPRLSREYARDAAGLLLVPAWDFTADGWLHGRMAVMRGVESGFSIARAPKQGILTVTDDRGRVLAERASNAQPFTTLLARVPSEHQTTLYSRLGDWFAWLCIVLFALQTAIFLRSDRTRSESAIRTRTTALSR